MNPKLSILIATVGRRRETFHRLLDCLARQIAHPDDVEVIAYWNNGEHSIGKIRNDLLAEARGDYVCFIDDDDLVPDFYVEKILDSLGEDYVGFRVKFYNNDVERKPVYHSLRYLSWHEDDEGYYRGVTHLNPIRRELALQGKFPTNPYGGEDVAWATQVTPLVKTEKFIDNVMYFYYHNTEDSHFGYGDTKPQKKHKRVEMELPFFRYHPDSKKES